MNFIKILRLIGFAMLLVACANSPKPLDTATPTLDLPPTLPLLGSVITDAPAIFATAIPVTATPLAIDTPVPATQTAAMSLISGLVWLDVCQLGQDSAPVMGCLPNGQGGYQADGQFNQGEGRMAGLEVTLKAGACPGNGTAVATTMTNGDGVYQFDNVTAGTYCVSIDSTAQRNSPMLATGDWTYPALGVGSVTLVLADHGSGVANFGWDKQRQKVLQSSPIATVRPTNCTNQAAFVADVTIPDNSVIPAGQPFVKSWRIRNEGSCTWGTTYALAFAGGAQLDGPTAMPLPQEVAPGGEVEVSVSFIAPANNGTYRSDWLLRSPNGETFGSHGDNPFYAQITINSSQGNAPLPSTNMGAAMIGGVMWVDNCQALQNGQYSSGCIPDGQGGYRADGILNNGEARLAGVQVRLNPGACPGREDIFSAALSDANGIYRFDKVAAGTYCVSINPLISPNEVILMPGNWTYPALGVGYATVTVNIGEQKTADFGWDYQNR